MICFFIPFISICVGFVKLIDIILNRERFDFCGGCMRKNDGFTLIELMVTIAVLVIIATMAMPSFQKMISDYQLKKEVKETEFAIKENRAIAKAENRKIALNFSSGNAKSGFENIAMGNSKIDVVSTDNILYFEPSGLVSSNLGASGVMCLEFQHHKSLEVYSITINVLGVLNTAKTDCSTSLKD